MLIKLLQEVTLLLFKNGSINAYIFNLAGVDTPLAVESPEGDDYYFPGMTTIIPRC
jgi:hypothetical protein